MSNSSPWDSAADTSKQPATDPWANAAGSTNSANDVTNNDWLAAAADKEIIEKDFSILDPFAEKLIPFDHWVEVGLDWLVDNFREFFQIIRVPVDITLTSMDAFLQSLSPWVVIVFFTLCAWQFSGKRLAIGTFLSLMTIGFIGAWPEAMLTLSLVFTSVLFSILIGVPLGIMIGKSDKAEMIVKPILDAMQTTPAFVYLIPIVMLFGIGNVPGVVVTIIFALPPLVRLTSLGIRQVPKDLIEASHAFGASYWQMLFKVELPVALPTIMCGVNQNLMLSLSMVVIASMIAVEGLGQMVLRGIGRLDMGLAAVGGLAIVLLAIILDRLTQSLLEKRPSLQNLKWYEHEPLGWIVNLYKQLRK